MYLVAVVCTAMMHYRGNPERRDTSPWIDLAEGFRYMQRETIVLGLLVMGFVPMTFGFAMSFLLPAFNADVIGGGPDDLGMLLTSTGLGALVGSLALARAGDVSRKGRIMSSPAFCGRCSLRCSLSPKPC